jgi:hypothetical protein
MPLAFVGHIDRGVPDWCAQDDGKVSGQFA